MRFDRRKWSLCSECPLNGQTKVWSECDVEKPLVVIIGEGPGENEARSGRPFVGPAGKFLSKLLFAAGIMRRNAWITNIVSCRPQGNDLSSVDGRKAIECCRPGFLEELKLVKKSAHVLVPVGNEAMRALGLESGISRRRGFVHDLGEKAKDGKPIVAIPTFHPSYLIRGKGKETGTVIEDLRKVYDLMEGDWTPPEERFNLEPTLGDMEAFRDQAKGKLVGVDIETTGLRPKAESIVVVGLALSGEEAVSFPILEQGGVEYWNGHGSWKRASSLLQQVLHGRTMFQNAAFDIPHLEANGWSVPNLEHDTILLHHAIHPELPHRLDYIVSLYGLTPYWKGEFLGRAKSVLSMDNKELRIYNLRDAVVLHQVLPGLLEDLALAGTERTYRDISLKLVAPTMGMTKEGLLVDKEFLKKWRATLQRRRRDFLGKFRGRYGIPETLNLNSDEHLDLIFHSGGDPAYQFLRAVKDFEAYDDEGSKRRKDTKRYQEIAAKVRAYREAPAFTMPGNWRPRETETGQHSYDEDAVLWMQNACRNRLNQMKAFVNQSAKTGNEERGLHETVDFLSTFQEYKKNEKLLSTYSEFPMWEDGRIHPNFKITGTSTGRLASGEVKKSKTESEKFNAQNIPEEARKLIIAPEGFDFLKADYSNLELRVLAYVSEDDVLIGVFDRGENAHDQNTMDFFGTTREDPQWKIKRQAEKVWIFRRNYGGGLKGAYEGVMKDVPGLEMTYSEFCAADRRYRSAHPAYTAWYERVSSMLRATPNPSMRNQFGRLRVFLGTREECVRAGLDYDMQSTAADVMNVAMIGIFEELERKRMRSRLVCQVHDELDFYRYLPEKKLLEAIIRKHMEKTHTINGRKIRFPIELSAGPSWGEQKPLA